MDRAQELRSNDAPAVMPALWPRVWEQEIKRFDRFGRQKMLEHEHRFGTNNADVRQVRRLSVGSADAAQEPFDAKKVSVRLFNCQQLKKLAVAATEIDVDRSVAAKQVSKVQPFRR